jgi:hypothetical protein
MIIAQPTGMMPQQGGQYPMQPQMMQPQYAQPQFMKT